MADRKQLKRADHTQIPNDDPFAELTRIMGFDPREPVSRAQPKFIGATSLAPSYEDDLSIDLEKELIGEFASLDEEAGPPAARASSAFAVAAQHIVLARPSDDSLAEDPDLVFDAELAEPPHESAVDAATERALSDELDAALASGSDIAGEAASPEAKQLPKDDGESATDELGEQPAVTFGRLGMLENAGSAAAEFEASADEAEGEAVGEAYYDAPLIRLGAARDFAHAEDSEAQVDMDFEAEFAAGQEADLTAHATAAEDDDLEAELSALLGRGATVPVQPDAEATWTHASSSDETTAPIPVEMTAGELYAVEAVEVADGEDTSPVKTAPDARDPDDEETDAEARIWEDDQPSGSVGEDELQAKLAAFDREFDLEVASEHGSHVHGQVNSDAQEFDQPAYADKLHVEETMEADEFAAPRMVDHPMDGQPVTAAPSSTHGASEEEADPFAMLAAMVRGTHPINPPGPIAAPASMNEEDVARSAAATPSESPTVPTTDYQYQNHFYSHRAHASVPDIETVDVPEAAVALADDLDIPEVAFDDDLPIADFDDFEAELASAFGQHAGGNSTPAATEPVREAPRGTYHHEFAQPASAANHVSGATAAAAAAILAATRMTAGDSRATDRQHEFDGAGGLAGGHVPGAYQAADDEDLDYDPALSEEMAIPSYREAERQPSSRRGLVVAAVVGGLAVMGGLGAFALSSGGGGSGKPELVRADTDPVKVRPENPGGTTVPNQDNKVFQTMNGTDKGAAPTQDKLISGTEEPVDMAARAAPPAADEAAVAGDPIAAEIAAAPKGEERVAADQAEETGVNDQVAAVVPRRVRTMVVRSDGTLVPSEEPVLSGTEPTSAAQAPAGADAAALEPADPAKDLTDPAVTPESTASLSPTPAAPVNATAPAESEAAAPADAEPEAASPAPVAEAAAPKPAAQSGQSNMPDAGPVVPSRPADQPVDVVGEVKPQQVAAATPDASTTAAAATPAGAWSVQIASQPNQAAAKSSYEDLARRYGSVIGGRGVNIVKAEIAGKGTFWRVRVPAGSRSEAISLCESYKSAGGNCFVSK